MSRRRISNERIKSALARYEANIQEAFLTALRDHRAGVSQAALIAALDRGDIEAAVNIAGIGRAVLYPVDAAITNAFVASGQSIAAGAPAFAGSFGFDGRAMEAQSFAREHVGGLITGIVDGQRDVIRTAISENIAAGVNTRRSALEIAGRIGPNGVREGGIIGLTGPQAQTVRNVRADLENLNSNYFTRQLRDKRFDAMVKRAIRDGKPLSQVDIDRVTARYADRALLHRANTIARTESLTALREGRRQGIEQAIEQGTMSADGVVREWSATMDDRTREDHREMDGQRVDGIDTPWDLPDGSQVMYPGDTSLGADAATTIQCRCIETYVIDWLRS